MTTLPKHIACYAVSLFNIWEKSKLTVQISSQEIIISDFSRIIPKRVSLLNGSNLHFLLKGTRLVFLGFTDNPFALYHDTTILRRLIWALWYRGSISLLWMKTVTSSAYPTTVRSGWVNSFKRESITIPSCPGGVRVGSVLSGWFLCCFLVVPCCSDRA